jgi:hypothetical protein
LFGAFSEIRDFLQIALSKHKTFSFSVVSEEDVKN